MNPRVAVSSNIKFTDSWITWLFQTRPTISLEYLLRQPFDGYLFGFPCHLVGHPYGSTQRRKNLSSRAVFVLQQPVIQNANIRTRFFRTVKEKRKIAGNKLTVDKNCANRWLWRLTLPCINLAFGFEKLNHSSTEFWWILCQWIFVENFPGMTVWGNWWTGR